MIKMLNNKVGLLQNDTDVPVLTDVQSALDLTATAWYTESCNRLIVMKEDISEDFFDLKTQIAGEILQKFVTYNFRIAIVGDFSQYASKALKDFIFESNKGNLVNFLYSINEAIARLSVD